MDVKQPIFGFDLGTNSIGWACVSEIEQKIHGAGSVIFQMGVELEKGVKEVSKNATRREKRQIRRQIFRRKIRKTLIIQELLDREMFPDIIALYDKYYSGDGDIKFEIKVKKLLNNARLCPELAEFFKIDPYEMRAKAYEGKQCSLYQLGRIIYQFSLRRGYRETLEQGDEGGKIYTGNAKDGKTGINETVEKIADYGTLGNYLFHEDPHSTRLRNRYTLRSMYTYEFDAIFKAQQQYYPETLNESFYKTFGFRHPHDALKNGILFYQRPLRSQKHLLGNCSFENGKSVAPKSCLDFEEFRAWTYANNIRANGVQLNEGEKELTVRFILSSASSKKFKDLRKKLNYPGANYNYADEETFPASSTHAGLSKIFKKQWSQYSEQEKEEIWHLKHWAKDPEWLAKHLAKKFQLDNLGINAFRKLKLAEGYTSLSRKAIKMILEFLRKGYTYDDAVLLAGVKRSFGDDWDDKSPSDKAVIEDTIFAMAHDGAAGLIIEKIRDFLREEYCHSDKMLQRLYHHSFKEQDVAGKLLPEPDNVRNPIVQQSLHQLRKLYNAMVKEYGAPTEVKIELARELKSSKKERDKIRKDNLGRREVNNRIKQILTERNQSHSVENIQKVILFQEIERVHGTVVNPFKPSMNIGMSDLFGHGTIQIEHIVPLSKSLNNSVSNKTLCDAGTNKAKDDRKPFEYFTSIGADWKQIKNDIFRILPYRKAKRFISETNEDAEDFISRQLNDTRYISRYAVQYIRKACPDVQIIQGSVTGILRHHWGMERILNRPLDLEIADGDYIIALDEEGIIKDYRAWDATKTEREKLTKQGKVLNGLVRNGRFYPKKDRDDHRHHAIDAIVVALSKRKHLQQLSTAHASDLSIADLKADGKHIIERPWEHFWTDARKAVDQILVYHHQNNRVRVKIKKRLYDYKGNPKMKDGKVLFAEGYAARGSLHMESVYGKHLDANGDAKYHIRKPIDFVSTDKHLAKVVDPKVREAIRKRLRMCGIDVDSKKGWKISDAKPEFKNLVFFKTEGNVVHPQVFMPNKNGPDIPIKKVRVREEIGNAEPLKDHLNQYVNPRNNHHVVIQKNAEGELSENVISFWKAVERERQHDPVYKAEPGNKLLFTMEENDLFLMNLPEHQTNNWQQLEQSYLRDNLFRIQNISSHYYVFRKHTASTHNYDSQMIRVRSMKALEEINPIKVKINVLGKIEP